jgi:hypothetical protein
MTFTAETPTPAPDTLTNVAPETKFVPVSVWLTICCWLPLGTLIAVSVGTEAALTVNGTVVEVPSGVVTVTSRVPAAADDAIDNVANIEEPFTTCAAVTFTPVPDTATVVAP